MLHEIFYWILNMSIIAGAFGLVIYPLRYIRRFPKFGRYALWTIVLIRLLCPVGISSEYSLLQLLSKTVTHYSVRSVAVSDSNKVFLPDLTLSNMIQVAETYHPITYKTNILEGFFRWASRIWLIGVLAALTGFIIMYVLAKAELKHAVHQEDNIYISHMVGTPTVYGVINPRIILPTGILTEHRKYILAHERTHIRRRDNLWRMFGLLSLCIHWFNPLIWLFFKCFLEDCELACDEGTVKKLKEEERRSYASALLSFHTTQKTVFASAFGGSKIRVRIYHILSYKRLTLFASLCFTVLLVTILYILLTNARY